MGQDSVSGGRSLLSLYFLYPIWRCVFPREGVGLLFPQIEGWAGMSDDHTCQLVLTILLIFTSKWLHWKAEGRLLTSRHILVERSCSISRFSSNHLCGNSGLLNKIETWRYDTVWQDLLCFLGAPRFSGSSGVEDSWGGAGDGESWRGASVPWRSLRLPLQGKHHEAKASSVVLCLSDSVSESEWLLLAFLGFFHQRTALLSLVHFKWS